MKKVLFILSLVALGSMISCDSSDSKEEEKDKESKETALDISVDDINGACDCTDAMLLVKEEIYELAKDNVDAIKSGDIPEDVDKLGMKYQEKEREIQDKCRELAMESESFLTDMENCSSWEKSREVVEKTNALFE